MCHEPSSDSGKTNNSMEFRPIEVHQTWNRHAGFNLMQLLGLQARRTSTVTCTVRNWIVLTRAFILICSSCTLEIGSWRKSDIVCLWFVTNFRWEPAGHRLSRWVETGIQILCLWALLMEISSHSLFQDTSFWRPKLTSYSKGSYVCIRNVVNQNMIKQGWYTGERELLVICRVAEQKLSFEVSSLTLQLVYGAWMTAAI